MTPRATTAPRDSPEPIAVVGMACRFPGANDIEAFWQLLLDGGDAIQAIPAGRWPENGASRSRGARRQTFGGWLEGVDGFDASFFGITPREAAAMDPQQRILLQVTWHALEHAGISPHRLAGSETGVFVGSSSNDYSILAGSSSKSIDAYSGLGNCDSILANRISFFLDLCGPSLALDAACASSLVATHLGCQSLRLGECTTALVGGVNLMLAPAIHLSFTKARMLSPDGRCKTFDARADGYVRGEGCGMLVLKRLADAERDGLSPLALIRGSAVGQDGRSASLTVPSSGAQVTVMQRALAQAGVAPEQVGYIEAHGTGTPVGDRAELEALSAVYGAGLSPCAIGSVKTNIGHLESAAGAASLIKTVLCLSRGQIPPHLHFRQLPADVGLGQRLFIPTAARPWLEGGGTRWAGVSSFGFGGTNGHMLLESPPGLGDPAETAPAGPDLLLLSARSPSALRHLAASWAQRLEDDDVPLVDTCHTSRVGRAVFEHRLALVVETRQQAVRALSAVACGEPGDGCHLGRVETPGEPASHDATAQTEIELLARRFVTGGPIDWPGWHGIAGSARTVAGLPGYAFEERRYWLAGAAAGAADDANDEVEAKVEAEAGPTPHRGADDSPDDGAPGTWQVGLSVEKYPSLLDHEIGGSIVVPGTFLLGLVFEAASSMLEDAHGLLLSEVEYTRLLTLSPRGSKSVQVVLQPEDTVDEAGTPFLVRARTESDPPRWDVHAAGLVSRPAVA